MKTFVHVLSTCLRDDINSVGSECVCTENVLSCLKDEIWAHIWAATESLSLQTATNTIQSRCGVSATLHGAVYRCHRLHTYLQERLKYVEIAVHPVRRKQSNSGETHSCIYPEETALNGLGDLGRSMKALSALNVDIDP